MINQSARDPGRRAVLPQIALNTEIPHARYLSPTPACSPLGTHRRAAGQLLAAQAPPATGRRAPERAAQPFWLCC